MKAKWKWSSVLAAAVLVSGVGASTPALANGKDTTTPSVKTPAVDQIDDRSDELIIKYREGADLEKLAGKHNGKVGKKLGQLKMGVVKLPKGADKKAAMAKLQEDPDVEYVELNHSFQVDLTPNDPLYPNLWGMSKIKADQVWDITTGSPAITIAVVDTGVDTTHPDLVANLVGGYNTITENTDTDDDHGHGTHVAGTAAGVINNGVGVAGVAGTSKIMPIKAMGASGSGYNSDIAEGVVWAADNGAKVINMSLGSSTFTQSLQDAINYAYGKGCLVVVAMGNDNTSALHYPAAMSNVVAVGATDPNNARATFSNYGNHNDVVAPGTSIYSTTFDGGYGYKQGTSMATPHVAGVAALVWSQRPNLTPGQLERVLQLSAVDLGTAGKDMYFGYGLVDTLAALTKEVDTSAMQLTLHGDTPDPYRPTGTNLSTIKFSLAEQGTVTVKIYDSLGNLVATPANAVSKAAGTQTVTWNGKNSANVIVPSGVYTYVVEGRDLAGNASTPLSDTITVDVTAPAVTDVVADPSPFAPDGTNSLAINYNLNEASKTTVSILKGTTAVKTLVTNVAQSVGANSVTWDGKNTAGAIVPDGAYTYKITATDAVGNITNVSMPLTVEGQAPSFTLVSDSADPFKVTGTTLSTIKYTLSEDAAVTVRILNSAGAPIKVLQNALATTAGAKTITWNGKNEAGALVEDGTYIYEISAVDAAGKSATTTGTITTDKTAPTVISLSATPNPFAPNGTDTVGISYILSEDAKVTVTIMSGTTVVKTLGTNLVQAVGDNTVAWDGKNTAGVLVADGTYTYKVVATDAVGFATTVTGTLVVEGKDPVITAVNDTPDPFKPLGTNNSTITYTLSEGANVTVKILDANGNVVRTLVNNVASTLGAKSALWNGKNDAAVIVADGIYTYVITATDAAGKTVEATGTITVDKTAPVVSEIGSTPDPFAPNGTSTTTLNYTLSEAAKVTVAVMNGTTAVKTLLSNIAQSEGANTVAWDGKNTSGAIVADGTYTFKITATDAAGSATTVTTPIVVEGKDPVISAVNDTPDPFRPLGTNNSTISYTLSEPANVTIKVYDSNNNLVRTLADNLAVTTAGAKTITWNGKNDAGVIVGTDTYTYSIQAVDGANKSATVTGTIAVDLTAPVVSDTAVSENPFTPTGTNTTSISYTLSESAKVTISIYNSSNALVKTVIANAVQAAGANSVAWNGKNASNVLVTAGTYTYKIMTTDPVGNVGAVVSGTITVQ